MPPVNEIKDAFDHFMRISAVKFGMNDGDESYVQKNLEKVFSHIYRATFELFDYIRIYQKDSIDKKLNGITNDALVSVFPEYYQERIPIIPSFFLLPSDYVLIPRFKVPFFSRISCIFGPFPLSFESYS